MTEQHELAEPGKCRAEIRGLENTPLGIAADTLEKLAADKDSLVAVVKPPESIANPIDRFHDPQAQARAVETEFEGATDHCRITQAVGDGRVIASRRQRVGVEKQQHVTVRPGGSAIQGSAAATW